VVVVARPAKRAETRRKERRNMVECRVTLCDVLCVGVGKEEGEGSE
jgi:hypothetical protein